MNPDVSSKENLENDKSSSDSSENKNLTCEMNSQSMETSNENLSNDAKVHVNDKSEKQFSGSAVSTNIENLYLNLKFPIWYNRQSLCWLDATMALLLHSKNVWNYVIKNQEKDLQLVRLFNSYKKAITLANDYNHLATGKKIFQLLVMMQQSAFNFIKEYQGCEYAKDDSPVFAITNFLKEASELKEIFSLTYNWSKCESPTSTCFTSTLSKTVVSFGPVDADFNMENPYTYFNCSSCRNIHQKRYLKFEKYPNSLIVYFMDGLPHNDFNKLDFCHMTLPYKVRAVIQYTGVANRKHFATWIRDPTTNYWLNCDDIKAGFQYFSSRTPEIKPSEIHVVMWETETTVEGNPLL